MNVWAVLLPRMTSGAAAAQSFREMGLGRAAGLSGQGTLSPLTKLQMQKPSARSSCEPGCRRNDAQRREGCGSQAAFTCDEACEGLNRHAILGGRAAREASPRVQRLRAGSWREFFTGAGRRPWNQCIGKGPAAAGAESWAAVVL